MNIDNTNHFADLPGDFRELIALHATGLDRALGYFGDAPYVIFGYCPGGGEVIWKDGGSSGFGAGGWKPFLAEVVPLAVRCGANVGAIDSAGTHVLVVCRDRGAVYVAARESAEAFLAQFYGLPMPTHHCLCGKAYCPVHPRNICLGAPNSTRHECG